MSVESKIKHIFFDHNLKEIKSFDEGKLENELDRIAKTIAVHIAKLEKVGDFDLASVQVTMGVKGNILVIGVDGGITLTYTKK